MAHRFHDLSLKIQLTLIIVTTCSLVLLVACAALAVSEFLDYRRSLVRDSTVLGDVISTNLQAAIAFQDEDGARKVLAGLAPAMNVVGARVFDQQGAPFADYRRTGSGTQLPAASGPIGDRFDDAGLVIVRPITLDGKAVGTIHLQVSLQAIHERMRLLALITAVVLASSLVIAVFLSAGLQRIISGPILSLAEVAKRITQQRDQRLRAPTAGTNEVGSLITAFNNLLDHIDVQNKDLLENEERIRAILNAALSAVVVVDATGRIIDWTTRAETMFGWTRDEALGRPLSLTIIPERLRVAGQDGFGLEPDADSANRLSEFTALRKDGSEFLAELSLRTLHLHGSSAAFCGFITDITERKAAELKLREQMLRLNLLNSITRAISARQDLPSIFQVVLRNLEDDLPIDIGVVYRHDQKQGVLTLSEIGLNGEFLAQGPDGRAHQELSITTNQLTKCLAGELAYEPDISGIDAPLFRRLHQAGQESAVIVPLMVDSRMFAILVVTRSRRHGFSSADCEFLRQLSDHVALAAHQAHLYSALQQAYDDLRQTQHAVMQQERLRALGQMASGIAHDINNAISPIALYTDMLLTRETQLSERGRQRLETISRAIDDVAHTVKRLGEFYRQREAETELAPVDANEMIRQVLDLTRAKWSDLPQQRGVLIQTKTDLAADLPPLMAVASEVREALTNLVFNAVDAMPEGGILTIRTHVTSTPTAAVMGGATRHVVIDVIDTGTGMNEETRRRCLEPFFTTKGERGTGLGLAMVYGILQRHQADIDIVSALGQGTTMSLRFPVRSAPKEQALAQALKVSAPLRILLIDDDPLILKSLRDVLESDGHQVLTANGGRAGIDAFQTSHQTGSTPAVVVTDLGMPHVDGRQVASAIKAISATTPVIMLTGWGQRLISDGEIPLHVDCVLSKPPKMHEVRSALAQLCNPENRHPPRARGD
jgi:PAS domain S-box-containing protein